MNFDLRFPIGIMFSLFGVILVVYGAASDKIIYETHSLGININLIWGLVMLAFGVSMLLLARSGRKAADAPPSDSDKTGGTKR